MSTAADDDDLRQGLAYGLLNPGSLPPLSGLGLTLLGMPANPFSNAGSNGSLSRGLLGETGPDLGQMSQPMPSGTPNATDASGNPQPWTPAPPMSPDQAPMAADVTTETIAPADPDASAAAPTIKPPAFDVDKAVAYLDSHATPAYDSKKNGYCARTVRNAIAAGGTQITNTYYAKDYGPNLVKAGFTPLDAQALKNYNPAKGDVIIYPAFLPKHPYGHMEMYDGKQWVSDFMQKGPIPFGDGTLPYQIYRP